MIGAVPANTRPSSPSKDSDIENVLDITFDSVCKLIDLKLDRFSATGLPRCLLNFNHECCKTFQGVTRIPQEIQADISPSPVVFTYVCPF